jgi:hypothetical protein
METVTTSAKKTTQKTAQKSAKKKIKISLSNREKTFLSNVAEKQRGLNASLKHIKSGEFKALAILKAEKSNLSKLEISNILKALSLKDCIAFIPTFYADLIAKKTKKAESVQSEINALLKVSDVEAWKKTEISILQGDIRALSEKGKDCAKKERELAILKELTAKTAYNMAKAQKYATLESIANTIETYEKTILGEKPIQFSPKMVLSFGYFVLGLTK